MHSWRDETWTNNGNIIWTTWLLWCSSIIDASDFIVVVVVVQTHNRELAFEVNENVRLDVKFIEQLRNPCDVVVHPFGSDSSLRSWKKEIETCRSSSACAFFTTLAADAYDVRICATAKWLKSMTLHWIFPKWDYLRCTHSINGEQQQQQQRQQVWNDRVVSCRVPFTLLLLFSSSLRLFIQWNNTRKMERTRTSDVTLTRFNDLPTLVYTIHIHMSPSPVCIHFDKTRF